MRQSCDSTVCLSLLESLKVGRVVCLKVLRDVGRVERVGRMWREWEGLNSSWSGKVDIFENGFCESRHLHKRFHLILQQ